MGEMLNTAVANPYEDEREETSAMTVVESERAIADTQAAMVVARRFPRNQVSAVDLILRDCTLPALAEKARFEFRRGSEVVGGPTIRLLEAIARRWGNIRCGVTEIARHEGWSECKSYAQDMETGFYDEKTFTVKHWRDTKQGGYALHEERDIYELVANMGARRKRACLEAIIPLEVIEQAERACAFTLKSKMTIDDELIKATLEEFATHNVTREMLEQFIQSRYTKENVTPTMMLRLKRIFNSLEEGASKPEDWFKGAAASAEERQVTARGRRKPGEKTPEPTPEKIDPAVKATQPQLDFIMQKASAATIQITEVCKAFKIDKLADLPGGLVNECVRWLGDPTSVPKL